MPGDGVTRSRLQPVGDEGPRGGRRRSAREPTSPFLQRPSTRRPRRSRRRPRSPPARFDFIENYLSPHPAAGAFQTLAGLRNPSLGRRSACQIDEVVSQILLKGSAGRRGPGRQFATSFVGHIPYGDGATHALTMHVMHAMRKLHDQATAGRRMISAMAPDRDRGIRAPLVSALRLDVTHHRFRFHLHEIPVSDEPCLNEGVRRSDAPEAPAVRA